MQKEYSVSGKKVILPEHDRLQALRIRGSAYKDKVSRLRDRSTAIDPAAIQELPGENLIVVSKQDTDQAIAALELEESDYKIESVLAGKGLDVIAPNRLIVSLDPNISNPWQVVEQQGRKIIKRYYKNDFLVRLPDESDPFEVAEGLKALPEVRIAEPDFITLNQPIPELLPQPDDLIDPLFEMQYILPLTQTIQAWELQRGNRDIKIAILDTIVDRSHEDLATAIEDAIDVTDDIVAPFKYISLGQNYHGTACAGIAAAVPNNAIGIRGVAGGCTILPVRMIYYTGDGLTKATTSADWIISALKAAVDNGADVINCSWVYQESESVTEAFERARTIGRGGRGCVIVTAAGDGSEDVTHVFYPATLKNVLTVSSTNRDDTLKTLNSEGESWISCFGPEVDVAAPGVRMWTTDISGTAGANFNGQKLSYYNGFRGTSASAPIVSGIAALVLSANKNLTEEEVRKIICESAEKKPDASHFPGGRNDELGHGRVNALCAVKLALGQDC